MAILRQYHPHTALVITSLNKLKLLTIQPNSRLTILASRHSILNRLRPLITPNKVKLNFKVCQVSRARHKLVLVQQLHSLKALVHSEQHRVREATMRLQFKNTRDNNLATILNNKAITTPVIAHTHVLIRNRAIVIVHIILMPVGATELNIKAIILRFLCPAYGQLFTAGVVGVHVGANAEKTEIVTNKTMIQRKKIGKIAILMTINLRRRNYLIQLL